MEGRLRRRMGQADRRGLVGWVVFPWLVSIVLFVSFVQSLSVLSVVSAQQPAFRTETRLIVTTVSVRDRSGAPVEGLTANDFIVTEDNEPQDIAFVEYQRLD